VSEGISLLILDISTRRINTALLDISESAPWCNSSYSNQPRSEYMSGCCCGNSDLESATMNTLTRANVHTIPFSQSTDSYWLFLALVLTILSFYFLRTTSDGKFYDLGGIPILTAWSFFSKRYDFIRKNFKRSRGLPFRFRVLQVLNFLKSTVTSPS
jgi:hypothetical protein